MRAYTQHSGYGERKEKAETPNARDRATGYGFIGVAASSSGTVPLPLHKIPVFPFFPRSFCPKCAKREAPGWGVPGGLGPSRDGGWSQAPTAVTDPKGSPDPPGDAAFALET